MEVPLRTGRGTQSHLPKKAEEYSEDDELITNRGNKVLDYRHPLRGKGINVPRMVRGAWAGDTNRCRNVPSVSMHSHVAWLAVTSPKERGAESIIYKPGCWRL